MANPNGGTGFPGQIQARDPTTKEPIDLYGDSTAGGVHVLLYIWNTDSLAWEKMTQPALEPDFYKDQKFDYTTGDLDYKGLNQTHKASEGAATWEIWKYTWVSSNVTRIEGPLTGSWTGRAALAWE